MTTRREFLQSSAAAGGGLLIAIHLAGCSEAPEATVVEDKAAGSLPERPLPAKDAMAASARARGRASGLAAAAGRFQGIALMEGYGTFVSLVAEVSIEADGVRVHRISGAADLGRMVIPASRPRSRAVSSSVYRQRSGAI